MNVPQDARRLRFVFSRKPARGAMLRGVVASVAVVAGTVLLVHGLARGKRPVTVKEASTTVIPAKPPPAFVLNEARRRGMPPPPGEPSKIIRTEAVVEWDPESRLVRDITVGALRRDADGLHRLSLGDGPALCPT
jgi:hypothetical protein